MKKVHLYSTISNIICMIILISQSTYLAINWSSFPDKIPAHYDAVGNIDRWGDKGEILVLPIITWFLYILITVVEQFPKVWNTGVVVTEENKERVYSIIRNMISTLKIVLVTSFAYITIYSILGKELSALFLPIDLLLIFGPIIYYCIKLFKVK